MTDGSSNNLPRYPPDSHQSHDAVYQKTMSFQNQEKPMNSK